MGKLSLPDKLPPALHQFFWDVDATILNPAKHPQYVINRLLDKGDLAAARWVLHTFPKDEIVDSIKKARDFSPRSATFFSVFWNIPIKEFVCMQKPFLEQRRTFWLY